MTARWDSALAAVALAVGGLVVLALIYAQPVFYEEIARRNAFAPVTWHSPLDGSVSGRGSVEDLVGLHRRWLGYVTGFGYGPGVLLFTADESQHMADVRRVFVGAEVAALIALMTLVVLIRRASRSSRRAAVLLRDGAFIAGGLVAVLGVGAALAFDALFLVFHELFFPQGNFLFGPDSNLIAMYPDQYWYETTLRIGLTFVFVMAGVALGATATLRQARR